MAAATRALLLLQLAAASPPLPWGCIGSWQPRVLLTVEVPLPEAPADAHGALTRLTDGAVLGAAPTVQVEGRGKASGWAGKRSVGLRLIDEEGAAEVELISCEAGAVSEGPEGAYARAIEVQRLLGGESLKWAVSVSGLPKNHELAGYFGMMGNLHEAKELVTSAVSKFSKAAIWRLGAGLRFMLDDVVMSDTRDEHIYHESLVHPALLAASNPERVLLIGGSEGASMREVLKDSRVKNVTMVDIDSMLVDMCTAHLDTMHRGSFSSPKGRVVIADGAEYTKALEPESVDVVLVDGVDFAWNGEEEEAHGNALFSQDFYKNVLRVLKPGGVLSQYMSDAEEIARPRMSDAGFGDTASFGVDVPSFLGSGAQFTVASKGAMGLLELLPTKVEKAAADGRYSFLTGEAMRDGLKSTDRRLKSGGGGGDGGECDEACAVILGIVGGFLFLCFLGCVFKSVKNKYNADGYVAPWEDETGNE